MFKVGDKVRYRIPTREEIEAEHETLEDIIHYNGIGTVIGALDGEGLIKVDWFGNGSTNSMYPCELQKAIQGKGFLPSWL